MSGHDTHDAHGHDCAPAPAQGSEKLTGKGLFIGLGITLRHFIRYFTTKDDCVTQQYPEVKPNLPPSSHGTFKLDIPKCIACGLCSNACPNKVITVSSEKDENNKKKLTGYKMLTERCLFCGLCVEACPAKALYWSTEFEHACYDREDCNLDFFKNYVPPVKTGSDDAVQ